MARYKYDSPDAGTLDDEYETPTGPKKFTIELAPGQEFDAPDDWYTVPDPHPTFKRVAQVLPKPAPAAPQE